MGYFTFDTETTGTDPIKDQIIEFYGLYADRRTPEPHSSLKKLDKVGPLRCRLMPNRLISPKALQVNGIRLQDINNAPMTEYEMTGLVEARLDNYSRMGKLISTAYNARFDERMLRMANFRSLRTPTALRDIMRQRILFDTLKAARAASRLEPALYNVPKDKGNKSGVTFRQGLFARANGLHFPESYEHSAVHDVEDGTYAIMHMVRDKSPAVWDMTVQTADTPMLLRHLKQQQHELFVHVSTTNNQRDITFCRILGFRQAKADSTRHSPHALVFNLAHNPDECASASPEQWRAWYEMAVAIPAPAGGNTGPLKVIDLREDHFIVPYHTVSNMPGLKPPLPLDVLKARHTGAAALPADKTAPLIASMTDDLAFPDIAPGSPIESYLFTNDREAEPTTDISSFIKKSKRTKLARTLSHFHSCNDWEERASLLPDLKLLSPRAYERALFLVGEHNFAALDYFAGDAEKYVQRLQHDLEDERSHYRTFPQALAEAEKLAADNDNDSRPFYEDMIEELHRMRAAKQRFYKTWDATHLVPPERETTLFNGTVVPEKGKVISLKIA